jgi:hypothetical protein
MASEAPKTSPPLDSQGHFRLTERPFTPEISPAKMWRYPELDELVDDLEATVSARMSAAGRRCHVPQLSQFT